MNPRVIAGLKAAAIASGASCAAFLTIQLSTGDQFDILYFLVGIPDSIGIILAVQLASSLVGFGLCKTAIRQTLLALIVSALLCVVWIYPMLFNGQDFGPKQIQVFWLGLLVVPWLPWTGYLVWLIFASWKSRRSSISTGLGL